MKNTKKTAAIIIISVLIAFIWGHSAMSRSVSKAESLAVGNFLGPFLELFVGKGNVTDHLVRKLAHFTEYAALGGALAYLLHVDGKRSFFQISYAALCAMAVAVVDEGIQLFADGRGAQVQDVLLDTGGAIFGLAFFLAVFAITVRIK